MTFILGATLVQGAVGATTMAGNALGNDIGRASSTASRSPRCSIGASRRTTRRGCRARCRAGRDIPARRLAAGATHRGGVGGGARADRRRAADDPRLRLRRSLRRRPDGLSASGCRACSRSRSALLFLSSMVMPRNLIREIWFEKIATYNPMSYLVEAPRSLLITGWDGEALALGCGIAARHPGRCRPPPSRRWGGGSCGHDRPALAVRRARGGQAEHRASSSGTRRAS